MLQTPYLNMDTSSKYVTYKITIFVAMYIGYALYVCDRKSFSFAMPALMKEEGLQRDDLGDFMMKYRRS